MSCCEPLQRDWRSAAFLRRGASVVRDTSGTAAGGGRSPFQRNRRRRRGVNSKLLDTNQVLLHPR